jgi:hypothetical protein
MQRFWDQVEKTSTCWLWKGYKMASGYGRFGFNYKTLYAHRFSYELIKGDIPKGMVIDHLCKNRGCVNPDHMEVVTQRENLLRGDGFPALEAKQTHCIKGHLFSKENTYMERNKRHCKRCRADAQQRIRNNRKLVV